MAEASPQPLTEWALRHTHEPSVRNAATIGWSKSTEDQPPDPQRRTVQSASEDQRNMRSVTSAESSDDSHRFNVGSISGVGVVDRCVAAALNGLGFAGQMEPRGGRAPVSR
jgi:hypothetical protein